ncbi:hypothetical protein [Thiocapsa bogorovii]|uniref:hypothetical protein n=1 Tax=Thiocapsa bogorovii TaxID=521689 RepID=UPI001E296E21|nr:hypothetical protein [Thiocapsa bogorovii]UHD14352.1 hypothetical protein LT988_13665 [Thiocapsa bogorovii]
MKIDRSEHLDGFGVPVVGRILLAGMSMLLVACASSGEHVTGAMQITLKPGETGTCQSNPCQVSFVMPPGTGTYEVTGNQVKIGDFPAGQTVSLGSLFGSNAIKVVGADVPTAYVYIPQDM